MSTLPRPIELTMAAVCHLPPAERIPWVERLRVFYPRWHQVTALVHRSHTLQPIAAEPPCLLLIGRTGVGKSTLLDAYVQQAREDRAGSGDSQPIVQATILPPATVKSLAATLLTALGDPAANRGTTDALTRRLAHYFRECGVQMLILDELQHFVDRDSQKILWTVSNWLKTLIKETRVACVLAGLASEADQVVDANPQLARLFGDPVVLAPFAWDATQPQTIMEFRALLQEIERRLPFQEASHLADLEMAQRCFVATDGVLGYLMALLRAASYLALTQGVERLEQPLLAQAFDERLGGARRGVSNPFRGDLPPVGARQDLDRSAAATNHRSVSRRARTGGSARS